MLSVHWAWGRAGLGMANGDSASSRRMRMVCNRWSWPHNIVKIQEKLNYTLTNEFFGTYELSVNKEHKTKMARPWCSQAGWGGASPEHPSACSAPPTHPPSGDRKTEAREQPARRFMIPGPTEGTLLEDTAHGSSEGRNSARTGHSSPHAHLRRGAPGPQDEPGLSPPCGLGVGGWRKVLES